MQQQIEETKLNVHIKVEYNQDFRRFVVEEKPSFAHLETTIRSLLHISPSQLLDIVFLDDEKDWVLVTNDEELKYACELSPSLLRLSVRGKGREEVADPVAGHQEECPIVLPAIPPRGGRGRGGRGGMRGVTREGEGKIFKAADPRICIQNLDKQLACLTERHAMLSAKLPNLQGDKAKALSSRISVLESKIEILKQKKERFEALPEQPMKREEATEIEKTTIAPIESSPEKFRGRGCRRGGRQGPRLMDKGAEQPTKQEEATKIEEGTTVTPIDIEAFSKTFRGRGCRRGGRGCPRLMGEGAEAHPLFAAFLVKKEELKAARQSGNREEIQEKWKALQEAKTNWREAKCSLKALPVQAQ